MDNKVENTSYYSEALLLSIILDSSKKYPAVQYLQTQLFPP